jgi:DNA-binding NarL/FixJ family response regulator
MSDRSVLVASADRLFGEAAAALFGARDGWRLSATAPDGIAAVTAVARLHPDAVLISGELPRLPVAAFVAQVRRRWPSVTVVVLGDPPSPGAFLIGREATTGEVLDALAAPPGEAAPATSAPDGVAILVRLTQRERTVLMKLAAGASQADIARALGVRENTVRTHMQNLYAKLGRHSRLEVVRFALEHGLVGAEPEKR